MHTDPDSLHRATLGPWHLRRLLGKGGMGAVYQAVEPETGTWAAIKVLAPGELASARDASESLTHELSAVRRLAHPHVVRLLGHGVVAPGEARDGDPPLHPGTIWLAMELISDPRRPEPRDWGEALAVLRAVLSALAHAHAHRVLHLDVKPDNVLIEATTADKPPRILLGDFGMAATSSGNGLVQVRGGTLSYMAPEQIRLDGRSVGPTTDLYAVGCLATTLVTGFPPFRGRSARIRDAHLQRTPPLLAPRFDVPAALQAWVDQLLEKAPEDRFPTAAHALASLDALGAPVRGTRVGDSAGESSTTTFTFDADEPSVSLPMAPTPSGVPELPCPQAPPPLTRPDAPTGWIDAEAVGEGPPLDPDEPAVQALWPAIRDLRATGVRVVGLTGPIGVGTLGVARAAARLAAEHGLGDYLELYADPARTLRRWTRTTGLAGADLRRHLGWAPELADALESGEGLVQAVVRALAVRARRMPVVLVAPAGTLTDALAEGLRALDAPVLVLCLLAPDASRDGMQIIEVAPSPGTMARRLAPWVRLDDAVAVQVEARSGGCARLAAALVAEGRAAGALSGDLLLTMAPGWALLPPAVLPEAAAWLAGLPVEPKPLRSLMLAALAEEPPGGPCWRATAQALDLPTSEALLESVRLPDGGWRPALREALRARLAEGDAAILHRALASHATPEAKGMHLALAGLGEAEDAPSLLGEASPLLLEAATKAMGRSEEQEGAFHLHLHTLASHRAPIPLEERARARFLAARCLASRGRSLEQILVLAQEARQLDPALTPRALALEAHVRGALGHQEEALAASAAVLTHPEADLESKDAALRVKFVVQRRRGELDAAAETLEALRAQAGTNLGARAHLAFSAGVLDAERGLRAEAVAHLDGAVALLRQGQLASMAAVASQLAAALLRHDGRLEEATLRLDASRDAGDPDPLRDLRYAQIALARGDLTPLRQAREHLRAAPGLNPAQRRMLRIMELPLAAAAPDPARWAEALAHARHCLDHRIERGELPWALEQAARVAARSGEVARAQAAAALAAEAWRGVNREEDAGRVEDAAQPVLRHRP